ncbi:MAG: hypothetical protein J5506_06375 [Prevotella sp.]|nr:hypothetical protein [Prevotella sp.]
MRKKTIFIVTLALAIAGQWNSLSAQTDPSVKTEVNTIRAIYAKAKKSIELNDGKESEGHKNDLLIQSHYVVPGTGQTNETIHYYYNLRTDEHTGQPYYLVYFISRKYNVAARQFYEEYLFDGEGPTLKFVFKQWPDIDGTKNEERYYFNYYGLIWSDVKGNVKADDSYSQRKSSELLSAFNNLLNSPD